MVMLRFAICDDDSVICGQLERMLEKISQNFSKKIDVDVFFSGEKLYQIICDGAFFDIIFLDIELPQINGIDVGKKIRDEMHDETTKIVYISGKDSYAMDLFDVRPLNFLIKPIQMEKLEEVLRKALMLIERNNHFFEYQHLHVTYKVPIKDIIYFESIGKKVKMVLLNESREFYGKLSAVEKQLSNQDFLSIHKSYLINFAHAIEYQYDHMRMSNKVILSVSQINRKAVRNRIMQARTGK